MTVTACVCAGLRPSSPASSGRLNTAPDVAFFGRPTNSMPWVVLGSAYPFGQVVRPSTKVASSSSKLARTCVQRVSVRGAGQGLAAGRRRHSVPCPVHPPHRQQRGAGAVECYSQPNHKRAAPKGGRARQASLRPVGLSPGGGGGVCGFCPSFREQIAGKQQKASRHSASAPSQHRQRTSTEEETSELRFGAAHPHANVTTASAALTVATPSPPPQNRSGAPEAMDDFARP